MAIPKIIHQTVADKTKINDILLKNIHNIKKTNKDWDYRLYDNNDIVHFISNEYGQEYLNVYNKISAEYGAARADFFRYLLLYAVGGVYLDIKSTTLKPLSEVIFDEDSYILSYWDNQIGGEFEGMGCWPEHGVSSEFQQWHIISAPKHPYLLAVINRVMINIENYDPIKNGIGRMGVLLGTGPIPYTKAIAPIQYRYSHRLLDIRVLGLEYSIFRKQGLSHGDVVCTNYKKNKTPLIKTNFTLYKKILLFIILKFKKFFYHPKEAAVLNEI